MKKRRRLILTIILIAGIALYLWYPRPGEEESVDYSNAGKIIEASQKKISQVNNYKYTSDVKVGEQIKVTVFNRVEKADTINQMADFNWDIPQMSGKASMYIQNDKIYVFDTAKNRWVLPSEAPTLRPFIDFFRRQLGLIDPVENLLKLDARGKNMSLYNKAGEEKQDIIGVQVIPDAEALSELTKALPPQLAGAELKDVKQVFWVTKDELVLTGYEVNARVSFFGLKTMSFNVLSEPKDYNDTKINLPKDLVEKLKVEV